MCKHPGVRIPHLPPKTAERFCALPLLLREGENPRGFARGRAASEAIELPLTPGMITANPRTPPLTTCRLFSYSSIRFRHRLCRPHGQPRIIFGNNNFQNKCVALRIMKHGAIAPYRYQLRRAAVNTGFPFSCGRLKLDLQTVVGDGDAVPTQAPHIPRTASCGTHRVHAARRIL